MIEVANYKIEGEIVFHVDNCRIYGEYINGERVLKEKLEQIAKDLEAEINQSPS